MNQIHPNQNLKQSTFQESLRDCHEKDSPETRSKNRSLSKSDQRKRKNTMDVINTQQYIPFQIPPNWNIAEDHMHSLTVGPNIKYEEGEIPNHCICCSRIVDKEELPLTCDLKELSFLGSGFPLFFTFIKYCLYILIVFFCSTGLFNILSSGLKGEDCHMPSQNEMYKDIECHRNWVTVISLGNKINNEELIELQTILNFVAVLLVIVLLQIFRRNQRKVGIDCDVADIDISDYSIMIYNIPKEFEAKNDDYDEDLKEFLEDNIYKESEKKAQVTEVNLCYDLQDWYKFNKKRGDIIKKKQEALKYKYKNKKGVFPEKFSLDVEEQKIEDTNGQQRNLEEKFHQGQGREFMKKYFTGMAFVSFNTEQEKEEILQIYEKKLFDQETLVYKGNILEIEEAPKPGDVYWENLTVSRQENKRRIKYGMLMTLGFLFMCFCGIIFLFYSTTTLIHQFQDENEQVTDVWMDVLIQGLNTFLSIIQSGTNYVLIVVILKISNYEQHHTRTHYNLNLAKKLAIAQFVNTSLINFVKDAILVKLQDGGKDGHGHEKTNFQLIFGNEGLALNQHYLMISNTFLPFFVEFFDLSSWFQKRELKKEKSQGNKSILTQEQAQNLHEKLELNIAVRYAFYINLMYTVAFYTPILPIVLAWTIVGLILTYQVDKYNILRRRTIKFALGNELSVEMTEMIEVFLPIFTVSNLIFLYYITGSYGNIYTWLSLIIGVCHSLLPMEDLNKYLFKMEDQSNEDNFYQAKHQFNTDYSRENPATRRIANEKNVREHLDTVLLKRQEIRDTQSSQGISISGNHQDDLNSPVFTQGAASPLTMAVQIKSKFNFTNHYQDSPLKRMGSIIKSEDEKDSSSDNSQTSGPSQTSVQIQRPEKSEKDIQPAMSHRQNSGDFLLQRLESKEQLETKIRNDSQALFIVNNNENDKESQREIGKIQLKSNGNFDQVMNVNELQESASGNKLEGQKGLQTQESEQIIDFEGIMKQNNRQLNDIQSFKNLQDFKKNKGPLVQVEENMENYDGDDREKDIQLKLQQQQGDDGDEEEEDQDDFDNNFIFLMDGDSCN